MPTTKRDNGNHGFTAPVALIALLVQVRFTCVAEAATAVSPEGATGGTLGEASNRAPAQSAWS